MRIYFGGLIALSTLLPMGLWAQAMGNAQYNNPSTPNRVAAPSAKVPLNVALQDGQMLLQAEILYNLKPQSYLAIFTATQEDSLLENTDKYMMARIEAFKLSLANLGLSNQQVFVDFISLVPKYEWQASPTDNKRLLRRSKTLNEIPTGFQLKKNIHVSFADGRLLDKIITAAAQAEIYDLAKIEVNPGDLRKVYEELRTEASKIIQNKLSLFTIAGIKSHPLSIADNTETYYPTENYQTYTAFASDLNAATSDLKASKLSVKYAPKDRTIFYNRLPYDQFDWVVAPEFTEPPIQIHYKMVIKYAIQNTELAAKQEAERLRLIEKENLQIKEEMEIRKIQAAHPPSNIIKN